MSLKFPVGESAGIQSVINETRDVIVTEELLDIPSGYGGDVVTYTATVKDSIGAALPVTFVAKLLKDIDTIVPDQVFDAAHYDPVTFKLTLTYTRGYPAGTFTIKLSWAEQII